VTTGFAPKNIHALTVVVAGKVGSSDDLLLPPVDVSDVGRVPAFPALAAVGDTPSELPILLVHLSLPCRRLGP